MIPMIRTVANQTGVSVIDLRSPFLARAELFPDTVHPNTEGAKLRAAEIYRALTGQSPKESIKAAATRRIICELIRFIELTRR